MIQCQLPLLLPVRVSHRLSAAALVFLMAVTTFGTVESLMTTTAAAAATTTTTKISTTSRACCSRRTFYPSILSTTTTTTTTTLTRSVWKNDFSSNTLSRRTHFEPNRRVTLEPLYHMGHSHAHHDHHHHHHHTSTNANAANTAATAMSPKQMWAQRKRRMAIGIFCFLAIMGPKLLRHKLPNQSDIFCLGGSWVILSSLQTIRRAIMDRISTLKEVGDAIFKHSKHDTSATVGTTAARGTTNDLDSSSSSTTTTTTTTIMKDTSEADRVTWIGVVVNLVLSIGKLAVGMTAHSSALIADAGHSLSDLVSDFITLWSVQIARLPPDDDHPYGHYKFEAIGSLFLSLTLLATGFSVGGMAYKELLQILVTKSASQAAVSAAVPLPGPLALVMAGISIASKEWLFRITKKVGEKLQSSVVIANAWHHRSDAYSSVLALLSIAWAMAGFRAADAAAGLLVAGMICMTGGDILVESVQQLSDSTDEGLSQVLHEIVDDLQEVDEDVLKVTSQRARQVGSSAFVDVTVETSPDLTTTATRAVEERFKARLVETFADQGRLVTATVHAKPDLIMTCPLLEASTSSGGETPSAEYESAVENVAKTTSGSVDTEDATTSPFQSSDLASAETAASSKKTEPLLSAKQIEFVVRQRALLLHPQQTHYNVQSVSVHFLSTQSVMVDMTLESIQDVSTSAVSENGEIRLSYLQEQAHNLQKDLEAIPEIQQAKISLDLLSIDTNETATSTSSPTTSTSTATNMNPKATSTSSLPSPLFPSSSEERLRNALWSSDTTASSNANNSPMAP